MSENTIADGLKLNYTVIVDSVNATQDNSSMIQKGNSLQVLANKSLRELIRSNEKLLAGLRMNFKSMRVNIISTGALIEAMYATSPIRASKGLSGNIDDIIKGYFGDIHDLIYGDEEAKTKADSQIESGRPISEIIDEFVLGLNDVKNSLDSPGTGSNETEDKLADQMKAMGAAIANPIKKILGPIVGMGKAMIKMALITEPIMAFFEGMLAPFKILGKIMKAFGAALGADLVPMVMQMVDSMVHLFPLLEIIMPLIFEGIAAIAIWIGYGSEWLAGLSDVNTETASLSGELPVLSGSFQSLNVYADNTVDSMTELGIATGQLNVDITQFSLNPITLEMDSLKAHIEGYKIDTTNMDTFFADLQNKANGLYGGDAERAEGQGGVVNGTTAYGLPDISAAAGATGGAMIGFAVGGPVGALVGAGVGALWGWLDDVDNGQNTGI